MVVPDKIRSALAGKLIGWRGKTSGRLSRTTSVDDDSGICDDMESLFWITIEDFHEKLRKKIYNGCGSGTGERAGVESIMHLRTDP
jgi:hypothetical protein